MCAGGWLLLYGSYCALGDRCAQCKCLFLALNRHVQGELLSLFESCGGTLPGVCRMLSADGAAVESGVQVRLG